VKQRKTRQIRKLCGCDFPLQMIFDIIKAILDDSSIVHGTALLSDEIIAYKGKENISVLAEL
jgi:hypothetical protein